jgi:hypothetical protein
MREAEISVDMNGLSVLLPVRLRDFVRIDVVHWFLLNPFDEFTDVFIFFQSSPSMPVISQFVLRQKRMDFSMTDFMAWLGCSPTFSFRNQMMLVNRWPFHHRSITQRTVAQARFYRSSHGTSGNSRRALSTLVREPRFFRIVSITASRASLPSHT